MPSNEAITPTPTPHNSALKILVCYHKPYTMPPNDDGILLPIQVGKALTDLDLHIQGDNELNGQPCDNISHKNGSYCELTAIYWAWKNIKKLYPHVKYVGLHHYRRYFAFNEHKYFYHAINKLENAINDYRVDAEKVINILESGRVIVQKKTVFSSTVAAQFCSCLNSADYRTLNKTIKEKFPDYYEDFMYVMNHHKLSLASMFVMKYEDFEKYCEWLFSVLAEVEPVIVSRYPNVPRNRIVGHLAERLLNVYIRKNNIKTKQFNAYFYGDTEDTKKPLQTFLAFMHRLLFTCKVNTAMFILNFNLNPLRRLFRKPPKKF